MEAGMRIKHGGGQACDVQVIKPVFEPELTLIRHNLLYGAWTKIGLIYVLYILVYELQIHHAIICKLFKQTQCPRV
jgi:hypothetical protein